jgi:hypothetical protein
MQILLPVDSEKVAHEVEIAAETPKAAGVVSQGKIAGGGSSSSAGRPLSTSISAGAEQEPTAMELIATSTTSPAN